MSKFVYPLIILCFLFSDPALARPNNAKDLVSRFQTKLIEIMQNSQELGVTGRYKKLAPLLQDTFHIPLMTRIAAGKYWNATSLDERKRLVAAFKRMSISTLATLFSGYSGETFEFIKETAGHQANTWVVSTKLLKTDGDKIDIAYVAGKVSKKWWLIDVIVDNGISELKVRVSEYDTILKEGGAEALIATLETKAKQLITVETD